MLRGLGSEAALLNLTLCDQSEHSARKRPRAAAAGDISPVPPELELGHRGYGDHTDLRGPHGHSVQRLWMSDADTKYPNFGEGSGLLLFHEQQNPLPS